jgi:2-polyprenyl-6-hydroxyphenyl methylase/3-demethylubiquinone-9 3-methyltransferase
VTSPEKFYDTIAGEFDRLINPYDLQRRIEIIFDELLGGESLNGHRVLDVGCGTGAFSLRALERGAMVASLDIGPQLLARARAKGVPRVVAGDAMILPFADARFDVVLSSECIEHTADPQRAVVEMLRVLRPGGRLVLTCPNRFWHWSVTLANTLNLRPYRGLENWPSWRVLEDWVQASGGAIVQHVGLHMFPFMLAFTHPLLRLLDGLGASCGPVFVNQALIAIRRGGRI